MPDIDPTKPFADMSPEELEALSKGADEDEKTEVGDEAADDEKAADDDANTLSDDPSELEQLQERVAEYEKDKETVLDLRRSVGRLQAELEKLGKVEQITDADVDAKVKTELGGTQEILAELLNGMDDTVIDPSLRAKINGVIENSRRAAERDSLVKEVEDKVRVIVKEATPEPQGTGRSPLEIEIVEEIQGYGLDDKDFDWSEASRVFSNSGDGALRNWFRGQIAEKLEEDRADKRRQSRKDDSQGSPDPAGTPRSDHEKLGSTDVSLDDKVKILRDMGALT